MGLAFASLLSCGREVTGPGGPGRPGEVQLNPVFATITLGGTGRVMSIAEVVPFTSVRVVLLRADGDTAVDRTVPFPADSTSLRLAFTIPLGQAASREGEPLAATLKYVNDLGDTVFTAGPAQVFARPAGSTPIPPPEIPARYTGNGADAARLAIAPPTVAATRNTTQGFTATVFDSADAPMAGVPVAFTSTDSTRVRVNLRTGEAQLVGARGGALVIAQTLTGQADTATVEIIPTPSAIALVGGGGQSVRQAEPFPQPVRVRVVAADDLPLGGVPVDFAVTRGQGTVSAAADTTDANGLAEVTWTAGDSAGVGTLTATVRGTTLNVVVTGTQLSSAPTTLTFETQPANIAAGQPLPDLRVVVRDATGDTVRAYGGPVDLIVTGGTAAADLVGERPLGAVNGVIVFSGLTVDRAGTGFRLTASITNGPSAQSGTFDVSPSLPAFVTLESGGGQSVPPSTTLPDSVVVRVTDVFALPKAGVTVSWSVTSGGGTVSPATSVTDANGRAAAAWTVGAGGTQELRATVAQLEPVVARASVVPPVGPPVLFLPADTVGVNAGRTRSVTVFLTSPTPTPLTVDLTTRDGVASWATTQLEIPAGGASVTAQLVGNTVGTTTAYATSAAGTDSMVVNVGLASVVLDRSELYVVVSDTMRVLVRLSEPAPAGGVTVTVQSADSAAVLLAPSAGDGVAVPPCPGCNFLQAEGPGGGALLAPPAGTASVTIAEGQLSGHLAILPIAPDSGVAAVTLTTSAPGLRGDSSRVIVYGATFQGYCTCEMGAGQRTFLSLLAPYFILRDLPVRVRTLDPAIAIVPDSVFRLPRHESSMYGIPVAGVAPGTTSLVAEAPGFVPETLAVTIRQPVLLATGATSLGVGTEAQVGAQLGYLDAAGARTLAYRGAADTIRVTATVRDPAIVRLPVATEPLIGAYATSTLRMEGASPGSTWIVLTAPGHEPDSLLVTVGPSALAAYAQNSTLGVGQRAYLTVSVSNLSRIGEVETVEVTSSDPAVLRVATPSVSIGTGGNWANVAVDGVGVGTATLVFRRPGIDTVAVDLQVVTPVLEFAYFYPDPNLGADSVPRYVNALLGIGQYYHPASDTVRVTLRSSNPAIVQVVDSVLVFPPGASYSTSGLYRPVGAGSAQLELVAPGYTGATSTPIVVSTAPLQIFSSGTAIGPGLLLPLGVWRPSQGASPLPVTYSVRGSGGSTIQRAQDTIPAGQYYAGTALVGGTAPGVDTVIATAAGYAPDTLVVSIEPASLALAYLEPLTSGELVDAVSASIFAPFGWARAPAAGRAARVLSRDTTIVRVLQDTIQWGAGEFEPSRPARIRGGVPGTTWLVVSSVDGSLASDSAQLTVSAPRLFTFSSAFTLGMQQQTYTDQAYVVRDLPSPTSLWVRLTSSRPDIATAPDSVLIPADAYFTTFPIAAGDTVGSARITFSAPGHASGWIDVYVVRTELYLDTYNGANTASRSPVNVRIGAGTLIFPMAEPVPVVLSTADTTVATVETDTLVIPAGTPQWVTGWVRGHRAGLTTLRATDARPARFAAPTPAEGTLAVRVPRVTFGYPRYTAPVGTRPAGNVYVGSYTYVAIDSSWVRVRPLGNRVRLGRDSLLFTLSQPYGDVTLEGLAAGTDTLVAEAPGWQSDSAEVLVQPGLLDFAVPTPATVRLGDSAVVWVYLQGADRQPVVPASAPITLTITSSTSLQATLGPGPIGSIQVPVGVQGVSFWIKGAAVGAGTLSVSAPGFASTTIAVTTRSP